MNFGTEAVAWWCGELSSALVGHTLSEAGATKNYLTAKIGNEVLLFLFGGGLALTLLSPDEGKKHLASTYTTPFGTALGARLTGARLEKVTRLSGDRVLTLTMKKFIGGGKSEIYDLVLEITGRLPNAFLVNEEGKIIESAIRRDDDSYRSFNPGAFYTPPPPLPQELLSPEMSDRELLDALPQACDVSPKLAYILTDLLKTDSATARRALFNPRLPQRIGNFFTLAGCLLPGAEPVACPTLKTLSREALSLIQLRQNKILAHEALRLIERAKKRALGHKTEILRWLDERSKRDRYRRWGEALIQNLGRPLAGTEILLPLWTEMGQENILVPLIEGVSAGETAKKYFARYRRLCGDDSALQSQLNELEATLADLEVTKHNIEQTSRAAELKTLSAQVIEQHAPKTKQRKKGKILPPHLKFSWMGHTFYVGMNARGNRYVTFEVARPDDLWFHIHDKPGSHVILHPGATETLEEACRIGASLALFYSSDPHKNAVDCCYKRHVKPLRGGNIGEVIYERPMSFQPDPQEWKKHL